MNEEFRGTLRKNKIIKKETNSLVPINEEKYQFDDGENEKTVRFKREYLNSKKLSKCISW